ncbi:hypothetical protein [Halomonas sp. GD1P12]|uniref:hypothetical protein n=1 Tax=Halomonas sp. GD1P12 TaxID=2982691 RepID=UPI0021E35B72|nr:hypothetical protein [Halomonas sp. GD1P12]UYF99470.1 hypothetical protein OCT39_14740 [Halomonas sp. GD1P12]
MTPEASRRHYLDAMGITAWACRYQLPNALATEACEWEAPEKAEPRQALHALLDEPQKAPARAPESAPSAPPQEAPSSAPPKSARALLGDIAPPARPALEPAAAPATPQSEPAARAEPVVFTLTCACIDGRWLSVHAGELGPTERRLLANMLIAAGAPAGTTPTFTVFKWPPMAGAFASDDPLAEAREGVAAFIAGAAQRQGWHLERLLYWANAPTQDEGEDTLARVLAFEGDHSRTLELPVWRAPALGSLFDAPAKRALWPKLLKLTQSGPT